MVIHYSIGLFFSLWSDDWIDLILKLMTKVANQIQVITVRVQTVLAKYTENRLNFPFEDTFLTLGKLVIYFQFLLFVGAKSRDLKYMSSCLVSNPRPCLLLLQYFFRSQCPMLICNISCSLPFNLCLLLYKLI